MNDVVFGLELVHELPGQKLLVFEYVVGVVIIVGVHGVGFVENLIKVGFQSQIFLSHLLQLLGGPDRHYVEKAVLLLL